MSLRYPVDYRVRAQIPYMVWFLALHSMLARQLDPLGVETLGVILLTLRPQIPNQVLFRRAERLSRCCYEDFCMRIQM